MSAPRVLVESRHDLPIVHFQLLLLSGSLLDPVGKEGLTRLTARLLRRGTAQRDTRALEECIDGLGAELGIETSPSCVRLSGSVIKRSLPGMLALLGELLHSPSLPESELGLVRRETHAARLELTDSDSALAAILFRRTLFRGHPYARPSLGSQASLDSLTLDDVQRTYTERLLRAERIIGFAGDITVPEAERLVATHLAPNPGTLSPRPLAPEAEQRRGRHLVIVDKPERTQTQIQIGRLGTHPGDPDHTALAVGNSVFGGTFTSRLMRAVRSERGWSYGASSRLGIDRIREAFSVWTFPSAEDAAPCIALELELLERWVAEGITDDELGFVKSYLVKSHAFSIDTPDKRLEQAIELTMLDLPSDYFSGYVQRVAAVTREEVNAAIQKRIDPADLTLCVLGTDATIGAGLRALPGLSSVDVVPFDSLV